MHYRNWCAVFVIARGRATAHQGRTDRDGHELRVLSVDYAFLRHRPAEESMTIVVVKDSISKAVVAHSIPCKSVAVDWSAQQLVRDIK